MARSIARDLVNALYVLTKDKKILAWLEANDPMALRQARQALQRYEDMMGRAAAAFERET